MICPHCKNSINPRVSKTVKNMILRRYKSGISFRDIVLLLASHNHFVSLSTVQRVIKEYKECKK